MSNTTLKIGDTIRVLRVPLSVQTMPQQETRDIFQRCVGKTLRIDGFDELGMLELNVMDDGSQSPNSVHHTIWIERECVELVSAKTRVAKKKLFR